MINCPDSRSYLFPVLRPAQVVGALLLAITYWLPLTGWAQGQRPSPQQGKEVELRLAAGTYRLKAGSVAPAVSAEVVAGRYYRLIQFDRLPTDAQRAALAADGRVELLTYMPQNAWIAALRVGANPADALRGLAVRAIVTVEPEWKLSSSLSSRNYPPHALRAGGRLALRVQVYPPMTLAAAAQRLLALGATVTTTSGHADMLDVTVAAGEERRLAAEPWVQSVEAAPAPPTLESERDVTNHRANLLNSNLPNGRRLTGAGVTVAIGDDGFVGPHIDFQGRLTNVATTNGGDHADHVTGIVGGAGNLNPILRGQATGATLRIYNWYADILGMNGPTGFYTTQSVRISSHSLGQTCNDGYTSDARTSDQDTRQNPALLYVHSAGNSGTSDCSYGAGANWGNITGGYKMGKNVLTVGNLTHLDVLESSSSRGPAKDGRIKPDICATGTSVNATGENNTYNFKSGTSMACPAVSGVLAQLYQAYRNTHVGADPNSALIKAAVLNTADDIGNPGPDFKHGYGRINALRAVEVLENTRYVTNTLSTGQSQTVSLTVPAGASQLKVMLYWADYEAASNAATALVNDLDLTLSTPAAGTLQPWVLNPAANATTLDAAATRGADHLNNMEQVTLDAPAAGTYTATISGFGIPQGPQSYYVVYSWVEDNVRITCPIGGEAFVPGETEVLRWDANTTTTSFLLEYSTTGGASWNSIGTAPAAARAYSWTVPNTFATAPSGQVRVRVVRGAQTSNSENLTVAGIPATLRVESVCPSETRLNWGAVTGATGYEVFKLGTTSMESVGITTELAFTVSGVSSTAEQWFSVRAIGTSGLVGRRANALRRATGTSNCPGFPAPTILSFTPTSGPAGTSVTLTGTNFTGATAVSFNGTSAPTFTVVNATTITVAVPAGALSGPLTVTTPNGQATSSQSFNTGTYVLNDNVPVSACSGMLYDSGGANGSYADNENFTKTFSPATAGAKLRLVFTAFSTETSYDYLYIYDGASTSAPLLGSYNGSISPGTVTAANVTGQLTLRFSSDYSITRAGFAATISCLLPPTPSPTLTSLSPTSGPVGTSVTLTGMNFTGATAVRFNGTVQTTFASNSTTEIRLLVPSGATTGNVTVTTPGGTSNGLLFTVRVPNQAPTALALSNSTVAENAGADIAVGTLSTTDPDNTSGFTYALVAGSGSGDNARFTISDNSLRLRASADYETQPSYAIRVSTTDTGGQTFEQAFLITVTNVNEAPNIANQSRNVAENSAIGTAVGAALTASDEDANTAFVYSITAGNTGSVFALNSSTGQLTVAGELDYETTNVYALTVQVSDGTLTDNATITVNLSDVAEAVDLIVSTTDNIPAGLYNNLTVTSTGVATISGPVTVNGTMRVQPGGSLNTNCQSLTGSGSFVLSANATIYVCEASGISSAGATGAVQVSGPRTFSPEATYVYSGTALQATGDGLPSQVRALITTNSSTLTLSQAVAIRQVLTMGGAGALTTGGRTLTLLSDATGTALLANVGTGQVLGNVTVQRYIDPTLNPSLGYRHISVPALNQQVSSFGSSGTTPVVNSAYNSSATPNQINPFPTAFRYDQARLASSTATSLSAFDKGWASPITLSDPVDIAYTGYTVQLPANQTLSFTGGVVQGTITIPLARASGGTATAAEAGWNLIGNPYASPVDLSTISASQRTNLNAAFYTYASTSQYDGQYRSYVNGFGNPIIGTAQAFFVRVSSGQTTGSLVFTNSNRVTSYAQSAPVRRGAGDRRPHLQLALTGAGLRDELILYAEEGATNGLDAQFDAVKLWNSSELNLATVLTTGEALTIDGRPSMTIMPTTPLTVQVPQAGAYMFSAAVANLPTGLTLVDQQNGTRTLLADGSTYVAVLTAGISTSRFYLEAGRVTPTTPAYLAQQVQLYPNPTDGMLTVVRPSTWGPTTVEVLNSVGQLLQRHVLPAGQTELDMRALPVGVYHLRLTCAQGIASKRLVRH